MKINKELLLTKCNNILKTLPLAHYLKVSTIAVELSESDKTSYFSPYDFKIVVAFNNIVEALRNCKAKSISDYELESFVRTFLYHELSHAILTPSDLMKQAQSYSRAGYLLNRKLANIIEDERIETLLKHYYCNVDFKKTIKLVIGEIDPKSIDTFEKFVFVALRLRKSPYKQKEINKLISEFIEDVKNINSARGSVAYLCREMNELLRQLHNIWDEYNTKKQEQENQNDSNERQENQDTESEDENDTESENADNNDNEGANKTESESDGDTENDTESDSENDSDSENESETDTELSNDEIVELIRRAVCEIKIKSGQLTTDLLTNDTATEVDLLKIIVRNAGCGVNNGIAKYGYSGRFNKNRFVKDLRNESETFKWFNKSSASDETESKKSKKKILNIWLDQSGSYCDNDFATNKILKALCEIERKRDDFEFNLIKVDTRFVLEKDKSLRVSKSWGGNALPKNEIEQCYKETNKKQTELNIVLFDGCVGTDFEIIYESIENRKDLTAEQKDEIKKIYQSHEERESYENLKVFNNKRTIFIVEQSNFEPIKKYCPNAKDIIVENTNYARALKQNVIRALDLLF